MSSQQVKAPTVKLSPAETRNKAKFEKAVARLRNDPEHLREMAELIDDKTPGRWLTIEEATARLDLK